MKKYAVIVAGGMGSRMGAAVPKQFLLLHGKPVLWHTLEVFLAAYDDMAIVLVVPAEHMDVAKALVEGTSDMRPVRVVEGGATRFHSVQKGLALVQKGLAPEEAGAVRGAEDAVVFVHDGVRCLASIALIRRCYEQAVVTGSAIPVVDSKDSVRLVVGDGNEVVDRSRVKLVQTPQTFLSSLLLPSYVVEYKEEFTDEATVVEAAGHTVQLVQGEVNNIKITTPVDLVVAKQLMKP